MTEQIITKEESTRKAEKKAHREAKNKAYEVLKELIDKQQDPKFKVALSTVRPSLYGISSGNSGSSSSTEKLIKFFAEKNSVKEEEIFKTFKFGRKDCAGHIRKHLKKSAPEARVWVSFNQETGEYKVEGKGVKAPQSWKGYTPVEENISLNSGLK